jgi:glycerol kinase
MMRDADTTVNDLRVDGGMVVNDLLMQFQADILDIRVVRPRMTETTILGAAFAAGLAVGFWNGLAELEQTWREDQVFHPNMSEETRDALLHGWQKAVQRSYNWLP